MKKLGIFVLAAIMVMGLAISAQAFQTIGTAPSGEVDLWTIINGWTSLSLDQNALQNANVQATLPAGNYTLINYADYAGYTQTLDVPSQNLVPTTGSSANENKTANVPFSEASSFGFTDTINSGAFILATDGTGPSDRLPGLIFPLAQFGGVGYIVAFEDGDGGPVSGGIYVGDQDHNDMVGYVVPIPPSALLMGSGLLGMGLLGWRRRLFG